MGTGIKVRQIDARESAVMHAIRAAAAFLVVFEHAKNRVIGVESDFAAFGKFSVLPRLLFNLGHEAVVVFFVLSGFLVGRKLLQVTDGEGAKRYFVDRFSRIYIVAIPALALSALLANFLMASIGISYSQPDAPINCAPGLMDVIGNALLLNKTLIPTICSNSPYWSIQNEVTYYLIFAFLAFAIRLKLSAVARFAVLALTGAMITLLFMEPINPNNTLLYSGFWVAGGLAAIKGRWYISPIFFAIFYGLVYSAGVHLGGQMRTDIVIGAGILFVIGTARWWYRVPDAVTRVATYLSDSSFSLYLFHMPIINLLVSINIANGVGLKLPETSLQAWFMITGYIAVSLIATRLLYHAFEAHTNKVRDLLLKPTRNIATATAEA